MKITEMEILKSLYEGPGSPVKIGDRTTTLRAFTDSDIPRVRDGLDSFTRAQRVGVKPRGRVSTARDKLNSVRWQLGKPGQGKAVADAAKVVERFDKDGAAGIAFRDIHYGG